MLFQLRVTRRIAQPSPFPRRQVGTLSAIIYREPHQASRTGGVVGGVSHRDTGGPLSFLPASSALQNKIAIERLEALLNNLPCDVVAAHLEPALPALFGHLQRLANAVCVYPLP